MRAGPFPHTPIPQPSQIPTPSSLRMDCMVTGTCTSHCSGIQSFNFLAPFYLGRDWPLEAKLLVSPLTVLFLSPSAAEIVYMLGLSWVLVPDLRSGLFTCCSGKAFRVRGLGWTFLVVSIFNLVLNHLLIWAAHQSIGILSSVWWSAHKEAAHTPSTGHMRVGLVSWAVWSTRARCFRAFFYVPPCDLHHAPWENESCGLCSCSDACKQP